MNRTKGQTWEWYEFCYLTLGKKANELISQNVHLLQYFLFIFTAFLGFVFIEFTFLCPFTIKMIWFWMQKKGLNCRMSSDHINDTSFSKQQALMDYFSLCSLSSSAYDVVLRQKVAVKKLSRPFQSLIHSRRSYRELRLLKHMKHENVSAPRDSTQRQSVAAPCALPLCYWSALLVLSLPLQVIGLLDVFTPAAALEDFNEL